MKHRPIYRSEAQWQRDQQRAAFWRSTREFLVGVAIWTLIIVIFVLHV